MTDDRIREQIHRAVDVHGASMQDDPFLAQRIIAQTNRKEAPRMKKLSTGMIIAIVLMLLSVTAVAVGLTVEDIWQQSFEKMNTSGYIRNLSDASEAEMSAEEAIAIARAAIIARYGTPEAELDAMGVYPTYAARGWDGKTDDYPSEWDILFSSRTDVDIHSSSSERDQYGQIITDYGPTGEYLVYINAETGEVTYCGFYTNDFWSYAQRIWDCGSYDVIHWQYQRPDFYDLPIETQFYYEQLLAEQGYEVTHRSGKYKALLKAALSDRMYCDPGIAIDPTDPQAAAAWAAVEDKYGFSAELLQRYSYIATRSNFQTGTDDIFIVFNYRVEDYRRETGYLDMWCDKIYSHVARVGAFLVNFDTDTTHVVGVSHLWYSEANNVQRIRVGKLLEQTDWEADDLVAFDDAFNRLGRAVQRMKTAGFSILEMKTIVHDYIGSLGGNPEFYLAAPDDVDVDQWFAEESEWDTKEKQPSMTHMEAQEKYGWDSRYWPLEVQFEFDLDGGKSLPREGEMTPEEAIARALKAVTDQHGPEALAALGDYTVGCELIRYQNEGEVTRWIIWITDDPEFSLNGYRVDVFQRDGEATGLDLVYDIGDGSNG